VDSVEEVKGFSERSESRAGEEINTSMRKALSQ
jgi:hypothetical protein